jgi:hypothetical protein
VHQKILFQNGNNIYYIYMLDIILLVLIFLIFIYAVNNYGFFEKFETPENELYQTENIKYIRDVLDQYLPDIGGKIFDIVSGIGEQIKNKISGSIGWIERCAGCVKFCGKEPYWGTCSRRDCARVPCGTSCSGSGINKRCSTKYCTRCHTVYYGCTKWRDKCTPGLPKWNCSPSPSGFSAPSFPSNWIGVGPRSC